MQPISNLLKNTIVVLNEALKHGFTQLPNYVLRDKELSFGARLTFAVLLSYAWQKDSCFPGQETMANDLGTHTRSLQRYLDELRDRGYISWKQRGLNQTNVYYILDYQPLKAGRKPNGDADTTPVSYQEATPVSGLDTTPVSD